jgi:hypothetical protein
MPLTAIVNWVQATDDEDGWLCERGHKRPVPEGLSPVHKYEPCRYPVGVKTACSAGAKLRKRGQSAGNA